MCVCQRWFLFGEMILQHICHWICFRFDNQINALVVRTPLVMKPRRRKANIDTDADIPESLPSPLQPQQLHADGDN